MNDSNAMKPGFLAETEASTAAVSGALNTTTASGARPGGDPEDPGPSLAEGSLPARPMPERA